MTLRQLFIPMLLPLFAGLCLSSCKDEDLPAIENEEEVIAAVLLTFTPVEGGEALSFTWSDPDGSGSQNPVAEPIVLAANTAYGLSISAAGPNGENISEEIEEEADEHMFFFGWTEGLFTSPAGNGNLASAEGEVNYEDEDAVGLPLGLQTSWTTAAAPATGTFTTILKHQPGIKSENATINDGETDIEIVWSLRVE